MRRNFASGFGTRRCGGRSAPACCGMRPSRWATKAMKPRCPYWNERSRTRSLLFVKLLRGQLPGFAKEQVGTRRAANQDAAEPSLLPTVLNVAFALLPSDEIASGQTEMTSASMTAYSTDVGPSSF